LLLESLNNKTLSTNQLVLEAEAAKEYPGSWHGRVAGGTGLAKLLS